MLRWQKVLNRGIGSVLIGLGVTLGLARGTPPAWSTDSGVQQPLVLEPVHHRRQQRRRLLRGESAGQPVAELVAQRRRHVAAHLVVARG